MKTMTAAVIVAGVALWTLLGTLLALGIARAIAIAERADSRRVVRAWATPSHTSAGLPTGRRAA